MTPQETNFAYKVRHALNEKADHLPQHVVDGLESMRNMAVSRKKSASPLRIFSRQTALAGVAGQFFGDPSTYWLSRLTTLGTIIALVIGLMGIYHVEEQDKIKETAEMDVAVLSDELPPNAYLDPGFRHYLNKRGN